MPHIHPQHVVHHEVRPQHPLVPPPNAPPIVISAAMLPIMLASLYRQRADSWSSILHCKGVCLNTKKKKSKITIKQM